jgi:hypothetical protein
MPDGRTADSQLLVQKTLGRNRVVKRECPVEEFSLHSQLEPAM